LLLFAAVIVVSDEEEPLVLEDEDAVQPVGKTL
jgi:hypothetical protein